MASSYVLLCCFHTPEPPRSCKILVCRFRVETGEGSGTTGDYGSRAEEPEQPARYLQPAEEDGEAVA